MTSPSFTVNTVEAAVLSLAPGDDPNAGPTVEPRDRSLLALLEIGAAVVLIGSFFVPWLALSEPSSQTGISWGGSAGALTMPDLLIPFATLVAIVVTLAGLAFPARGAKILILVAFAAASYGSILRFQDVLSGGYYSYLVPPTAGVGLWLFAGTAAAGVVLAVVDLVRGGNSTFAWRAIRRPSVRRYGHVVAYVVMLLITLPLALFPMDPSWWIYVWLAALLMLPLWVVRARRAR
jgi:hypothetical protein